MSVGNRLVTICVVGSLFVRLLAGCSGDDSSGQPTQCAPNDNCAVTNPNDTGPQSSGGGPLIGSGGIGGTDNFVAPGGALTGNGGVRIGSGGFTVGTGGILGIATGGVSSVGGSGNAPSTGGVLGSGGAPIDACGDGRCTGSETQASCCADCGCQSGSSCSGGTCVVDPRCGDGSCNGAETQGSCCADCGCPSGSSCSGGTCVVQPRCGDGSCNGSETQDSCCTDCGCPSGSSCSGGTCRCTQGTVTFTSALHDTASYCVNLQQSYTQQAAAYLTVGGQTFYIPDGGYVTDTDNIGTNLSGTFQCCVLDGCVGNLSCNTPFGAEPCVCLTPQNWSTSVNQCTSSFVICQ